MQTTTTGGLVEGLERHDILQFRDIPYATAARFGPPRPVEPWSGVRDATAFGPICTQNPSALETMLGAKPREQREDALSLSVFTPGLDGARPVIVWIHGGGFTGGSGTTPWYDGTALAARHDVVVVTINYRLGAFGFMRVEHLLGEAYAGGGNAGLQDQIAALRWVADNAASFGGDPGAVTVFGESAGGMSIGTLLGTPAASGLFRGAIPQSGACHNVSPAASAEAVTASVLDALGSSDPAVLLDATPAQLLAAQLAAEGAARSNASLLLPFQPSVDGTVLPRPPLEAIADGAAADVRLLTGTTADEWALFHVMTMAQGGPLDETELRRRAARAVPDPARADEVVDAYRSSRPEASPDQVWIAMVTDQVFRIPAIRLADAQAEHNPDTWLYRFNHRSGAFGGVLGACHAIDVPFVFDALHKRGVDGLVGEIGPRERALAAATSAAWAAFARHGDPNHDGLADWPAHDATERPTMELGHPSELRLDPDAAERAAWDGLL